MHVIKHRDGGVDQTPHAYLPEATSLRNRHLVLTALPGL